MYAYVVYKASARAAVSDKLVKNVHPSSDKEVYCGKNKDIYWREKNGETVLEDFFPGARSRSQKPAQYIVCKRVTECSIVTYGIRRRHTWFYTTSTAAAQQWRPQMLISGMVAASSSSDDIEVATPEECAFTQAPAPQQASNLEDYELFWKCIWDPHDPLEDPGEDNGLKPCESRTTGQGPFQRVTDADVLCIWVHERLCHGHQEVSPSYLHRSHRRDALLRMEQGHSSR
ncbi:hypothetical protein HPB50_010805 [Hyalomma asiaticum]|uniref:Uncharacterized protein n=1 Tax=Hyalomma asiaticum TaxID=266040 RepID=A0ACB7SRS8_HYAAI|nr:hypothetical protein HPB50_010805 [Hyalomma asiaticum]